MSTAKAIIQRAMATMADEAGTRWSVTEWVRALNDMQRAIHAARPDTTTVTVELTTDEGHLQQLPPDVYALVEITSNRGGRPIRQAHREMLDAADPDWRTHPRTNQVRHFMYDPRRPREYELYPPAPWGHEIEALVSMYPVDVPVPEAPGEIDDVTENVTLAAEFWNALYHLILWRAYLKAAEFANEPAVAQAHLDAATREVGAGLDGRLGVGPGVQTDGTAKEPA